ncbi:MAG TPA: DivIVA domain-containing protein [Arachnia sp.]|nr:DivIVA domain-containing protein [Arachnia sp.]HMT87404.1 DivIVA domain-containing protein [Arachnia sp.]
MSLTLDEVAQIRFRMARRNENGYKVSDVDLFIDKVEETFRQFENERDLMRRELDSVQRASVDGAGISFAGPDQGQGAELQELRDALAARDAEAAELRAETERLTALNASLSAGTDSEVEIAQLSAQNQQLRSELDKAREELDQARTQRIISQPEGSAEQLVVTTSAEAAPAVTRLLQMATEQSTTLVAEAEEEAKRKLVEAERRASEIKTDARTRADRIESEARVNAEAMLSEAKASAHTMTSEAEAHAADVDNQAAIRRHELFNELEREQGILSHKVRELRSFENEYRTNLSSVLQGVLDQVNGSHPEPGYVPDLARQSQTPRLDALTGE